MRPFINFQDTIQNSRFHSKNILRCVDSVLRLSIFTHYRKLLPPLSELARPSLNIYVFFLELFSAMWKIFSSRNKLLRRNLQTLLPLPFYSIVYLEFQANVGERIPARLISAVQQIFWHLFHNIADSSISCYNSLFIFLRRIRLSPFQNANAAPALDAWL